MSQIKILKQDIINSLKTNIKENNVLLLIDEIKLMTSIDLKIQVKEKPYMW
jgi:hypothetical protein